MIERCIERFRQGACGTCERRDSCDFLRSWQRQNRTWSRRTAARPDPRTPANSPFLAFLGEVAKAIETGVKAHRSPFRKEVEAHIEPLLESGDIRIERVARALGCSRQTLYRRLKAEGVTFAGLVDALRRRLALRFVREQKLPVKEAAYRLGFSDPAAFSRAFKRWTGSSPRGMQR